MADEVPLETLPPKTATAAKTVYVPTDDGWALALHVLPGRGPKRRHPVLMVHGVAANRLHFDLDERHSLARAARNRGFDVYMLELRGAGMSQAAGDPTSRHMQWGFADYAERDLPTAMSYIFEQTQATALHGVGHSMGGMLLYSAAAHARHEVQSLVTIGSPLVGYLSGGLGARERRLLQLAGTLSPAVNFTPPSQRRFPLRRLLGVAGMVMPLSSRLADNLLLNVANCEPEVMLQLARQGIHDIPIRLISEITQAMTEGRGPHGPHGPYAYEAILHRIVAPVLALSGSVDRIAPPAAVAAGVARLASTDIRYREMGVAHGDRAEYGHADLLVGRNAPEEIYPLILDFLQEVD
jgi:predicted alpha/beta hydrolase